MWSIVNDDGLVLEVPNSAITGERYNPLFNTADELIQEKGAEFKAPKNQANKRFLKGAHRVESDNTAYLVPVSVSSEDQLMVKGNMYVRVTADAFVCNLEPNLTTVIHLLKVARLTDIRTLDYKLGVTGGLPAHMLDTAQNPGKYNYIFFPVANPGLYEGAANAGMINYFNKDTNAFEPDNGSVGRQATTPFFKLTYILKKVAEYLGFTATGDFFQDPRFANIVIYTQLSFNSQDVIYPSMRYMPYMLISDFLKQLRERFHLIIDFNLAAGEMSVDSFYNIYNSPDAIDLSEYLVSANDQETPEEKGYTVTLKSDETDRAFVHSFEDEDTFPPKFKLVVGNGEANIEMACSTTANNTPGDRFPDGSKSPKVDQLMLNYTWGRNPGFRGQYADDLTSVQTWPLRFMNYLGWQEIAPGKYWPQAESVELDKSNTTYFKFLNDSKKLTDTFLMPPAVMSGLNLTKKYCYRTEEMNYVYFLIEKNVYDLVPNSRNVNVKLYSRTLNYNDKTKAAISPVNPDDLDMPPSFFKAYFDPDLHGFRQLDLELVNIDPRGGGWAGTFYTAESITSPTDNRCLGGISSAITRGGGNAGLAELRITQGRPKYLEHLGQRVPFVDMGDFFKVEVDMAGGDSLRDWYWINF